jgi:hypothetical protein
MTPLSLNASTPQAVRCERPRPEADLHGRFRPFAAGPILNADCRSVVWGQFYRLSMFYGGSQSGSDRVRNGWGCIFALVEQPLRCEMESNHPVRRKDSHPRRVDTRMRNRGRLCSEAVSSRGLTWPVTLPLEIAPQDKKMQDARIALEVWIRG